MGISTILNSVVVRTQISRYLSTDDIMSLAISTNCVDLMWVWQKQHLKLPWEVRRGNHQWVLMKVMYDHPDLTPMKEYNGTPIAVDAVKMRKPFNVDVRIYSVSLQLTRAKVYAAFPQPSGRVVCVGRIDDATYHQIKHAYLSWLLGNVMYDFHWLMCVNRDIRYCMNNDVTDMDSIHSVPFIVKGLFLRLKEWFTLIARCDVPDEVYIRALWYLRDETGDDDACAEWDRIAKDWNDTFPVELCWSVVAGRHPLLAWRTVMREKQPGW